MAYNQIQLPPVPQPIGIFDQLIARQCETIMLREKVLSLADSFDIRLATGLAPGQQQQAFQQQPPVMRLQGRHMTVSERKALFDAAGNHLFDIVKEHFHLHTTYAVVDPAGNKLMEIKSSFVLIGTKATATFRSVRTGRDERLVMHGNFLETKADITDEATGAVVARIERRLFNARDLLFDAQTYAVVIAPGVDMALIAAMCIALDEKHNEERGA